MKLPARRAAAALVALVATALVLTACAAGAGTSAPRPTKTPDVSGVSAELLPYYSQAPQWEECEGEPGDEGVYECASINAPLDWENTEAGEIELAMIRRQSTDTEPVGSLLINPGGPGASGVSMIAEVASAAVTEPLMESFDVVGFDPRGVGQSTAVTCFDAADMDAYLFDIPEGERGSPEWVDDLTQRSEEFAQACEAGSDGILPYITTVNAARDLDLLRAVLGDTQLNYLGYSYGTFLGATFAELYPDRVGRLVLDGAIDPAASGAEVGVTQARGFTSALRAYASACLAAEGCPFAGTPDDVLTDIGTLLASVDADPLPNADGRELGADALMTGIVAALYAEESWPYLSQALAGVLEGDASIAFVLADFYFARTPEGVYEDNSTEAFTAYNCMDYPEDDPEGSDNAEQLLEEEAPAIAPYWAGVDGCAAWPAPPTGTRGEIVAEGAAPIVVIGTTNDPATPYEWSVSLADQLASGTLITREGEGHTGFNKGNTCVDEAVEAYLIDGTVPEADLTC